MVASDHLVVAVSLTALPTIADHEVACQPSGDPPSLDLSVARLGSGEGTCDLFPLFPQCSHPAGTHRGQYLRASEAPFGGVFPLFPP